MLPRPYDTEVSTAPRLYKVVYNSDLHEELMKAQEELANQGRGAMMMHMDAMHGFNNMGLLGNKKVFELFDPMEEMRKEPQQ